MRPDAIVSSSWLRSCTTNWLRACDYLHQLQLRLQNADQQIYNSILSTFSEHHSWRQAVSCYKSFDSLHLRRDSFTFSSLLRSHERHGHWQQAVFVVEKASAVTSVLLSGLLAAYESCARWREALEGLRHALDPDLICYSAAISACEKACQWREGASALRESFFFDAKGSFLHRNSMRVA